MHGPRDFCRGIIDFHRRPRHIVMGENAAARRLAFNSALRVLKSSGRIGVFIRTLWADEKFVEVVAKPGSAYGWMDFASNRHLFISDHIDFDL